MSAGKKSVVDPFGRDFSITEYPFYLLTQATSLYALGVEDALKPLGFNKSSWRVLMTLREEDGASISKISQMSSIRRSTISRVVEKMEREGLVERSACGKDNRVSKVYIMPAGDRALEQIIRVISRQYRRAVAGVPSEEIIQMKQTLRKISKNLKDKNGAAPFK